MEQEQIKARIEEKIDKRKVNRVYKLWGKNRGYQRVMYNDKLDLEHRVVWMLKNGDIPDGYEIHHINGIRGDNRIENLQMLSRQEHFDLHKNFGYKGCVPHNKGKKQDNSKQVKVRVENFKTKCYYTFKMFQKLGAVKLSKFLGITSRQVYERIERFKEICSCHKILSEV